MLDAYIIDRIRKERQREQEKRDGSLIPLHIDVPREEREPPTPPEPRPDDAERGSTSIDFRL